MKICNVCKVEKPLTEFGINHYYDNRCARDGRNIYCKICARSKGYTCRTRARAARMPKAPLHHGSYRIDQKKQAEMECKVFEAVKQGINRQWELARQLRLPLDTIGEVVAELMIVKGKIKHVRAEDGEAEYFVKRAA